MEKIQYKEMHDVIIDECSRAMDAIDAENVLRYIEMIQSAEKVFFVGVGRVLLSLEAMAKRYAHLGIRAVIVGDRRLRQRGNTVSGRNSEKGKSGGGKGDSYWKQSVQRASGCCGSVSSDSGGKQG